MKQQCIHRQAGLTSSGVTLPEVLVAGSILLFFMAAIYSLNSQCISIMRSKRNLGSASQLLQERVEMLRNAGWDKVTNTTELKKIFDNETKALSAGFMGISSPLEKATITGLTSSGQPIEPSITVTRSTGGATVSGSLSPSASTVRVDLAFSWTEMGKSIPARQISTTLSEKGLSDSISTKSFVAATPGTYP